ncbi:MAG: replicative DNA helicase [Alphaproteobacteria bacterium]
MDKAPYTDDLDGGADDPADPQIPANVEAEQALLGAILVNNEAYFQAESILSPEHFYEDLHARIFRIIGDILEKSKVATPVIVDTYLRDYPGYQDVGGSSYLVHLAAASVNIINVKSYAQTIFDLSVLRGLMTVGEEIWSAARSPNTEFAPIQQIERAEQHLYDLAEKGKYGSGFTDFKGAAKLAIEMAEAAYKRDGHLSGLSTGLTDLDRMLGGLQASDLIVLAGRPAMGKTSLATNIATNVARRYREGRDAHGKPKAEDGGVVGFFSLEMSAEQLATRILAEQAEIPSHHIRRGQLDERSFRSIVEAVAEVERMPLHIDDTGGISIASLASRARRLQRQQGLDLLVVDYIQLLQPSGRKRQDSRVQEITEITQGLKALAKELNVPVIALSQLSRAVEAREDKRPQLADLRESGSIEQDADVVLFVYREEYYHEAKKPDESETDKFQRWLDKAEQIHGKAEILIGKQRHGPVGTVELQFHAELTRFGNLAREGQARPVEGF